MKSAGSRQERGGAGARPKLGPDPGIFLPSLACGGGGRNTIRTRARPAVSYGCPPELGVEQNNDRQCLHHHQATTRTTPSSAFFKLYDGPFRR